jgi:prepilin-type N-terminal cleavage/methylation domain-containing protein
VTSSIRSSRGFTLIEIVVAMTIVGLGVVTLLEVFSSGLRLGARSEVRTEAVTHGRRLMDELLARPTLREGAEQGSIAGGGRWNLEVRPASRAQDRLTLSHDWELKEAVLDVTIPDGGRDRRIELRTLRLVKKGTP